MKRSTFLRRVGGIAAAAVFARDALPRMLDPVAPSVAIPEGSFLYLDGGTLELGLIRDSMLNSTNEYQIFAETFELIARDERVQVVSTA